MLSRGGDIVEFRRLSPEIEWACADPGSQEYFPAVHGGATLVFSVRRWPGELFTLWLPENVHAAGVHPIQVREDSWEWDGSMLATRGWSVAKDGAVVGDYRAEVHPVTHGLRLVVRMRNLTARAWSDPWANICLKLAHAPSFDDPDLARTFVRFRGRWTPLCEKSTLDHREHYRIVLTRRRSSSMLDHLAAENVMTAEPADHNLVAVTDPGGGRCVGLYAPEAVVLVFNGSPRVRCIHSNPAALPSEAPSGAETTAEAYLWFLDAPLGSLTRLVDDGRPL